MGRGSRWGNPYRLEEYGRERAIELYREVTLAWHPELIEQLRARVLAVRLAGLEPMLACWCAPEPCHGDVLVDAIEKREAEGGSASAIRGGEGV